MAKIKLKSASLSSDPEVKVPRFYFMPYSKGMTVTNNEEEIDFVTDGKSLYVAFQNGQVQLNGDEIGANSQYLLKIVSQGEKGEKGNPGIDGAAGVVPEIGAEYIDIGDEKKLALTVGGKRKAMTGDLTPPVYVPTLVNDRYLTWEWNGDEPATIDLMKLRPVNERPILLRTNSDNTKLDAEVSGPANFIQWKYEGDEHWTNLISIQELMNLAFAGMCTWEAADGKWHFGYKEVVKATYDSTKSGRRIINRVELGQILFDAGEIPLQDYGIEIEMVEAQLEELKNSVQSISIDGGRKLTPDKDGNVDLDLSDYAKKSDVPDTVDAYTKAESDAKYQPKGNYVKSVNDHTPDANGNVTVTLGDFDLTAYVKKSDLATINGAVLYNGGNINISGGTVIGLQDVEVSVSNGKLRYRKKENGTWGSYTNIMDVPASTGDGDTVNGFVNVSLSGNVLTFTRQDGTTKEITLPSSGEGQGCEYCWTEAQILELINGALSNYYTKSQVYTKGEVDAMLGQNVNSYRTFMIFKRSASPTSETLPTTAITWNVTQGELDIPSGSNGWTEHPENATSQEPYLWMASASFQSVNGERVGNWDGPFCLTGEDGKDGVDGAGIEFAYILCTKAEYNSLKNTTPVAEHGDGRADDLPSGSTTSGNSWTDHPSGISEEFPIEAVTIRKKTNGTWSAYSKPTIWSMWGEDGVDGDGVEYIFCVTAEPTIGAFAAEIPLTQPAVDALEESYQVDDWLPNNGNGNWTDNPLNVSESQPYEWVAIRKYRDGSWGPFSEPRVWGLWGQKTITTTVIQDGTTYYKPYTCYAFTRTNTNLTGYSVEYTFDDYSQLTPEQKSAFYDNPLNFVKTLDANGYPVNNITWYDTVPNTSGQLWLITNHIGDEGDQSETGWNGPIKWGDNAGFQIEYAISDENTDAVFAKTKTLPSLNPYKNDSLETIDETAWRAAAAAANCGTWSDEMENPVYMATAYKKGDGNWSSWTVAKVKGENGRNGIDGTDGSDGKSIEFVYYRTKGAEPSIKEVNDVERGTYDPEDAAQRTETDKDLDRDDFFPAVAIDVKTDGDYWHDHPSGVTEQLPYEWVATRTSAIQNGKRYWTSKFSVALWSKFGADGRDGDGIEYVFWGLSEEQVSHIDGSVYPTRLSDTDYTDSHHRHIYESECLPIIDLSEEIEAVDNNPGIADNKYVYASMRKYNGTTKTWGEFSEIKLWNEQSDSELNRCVLQIENDSESVLVNDLNVVDDSFNTFDINVDDLWLRNNTTLLNIDKIAVNGVDFVTFSGQSITPISGASATIELDATHNLYVTYAGAYVSSDRYNTKSIRLTLTFTDNSEIIAPIAIPISAYSGDFIGTDLLTIFPVNTNELVKLSTTITKDFYTSTRGSYDYDQSTIGISTSEFYQSPIKAVEKINYWVAFDQPKDSAFTSGTSYFGPFSVPNAEREGAPGVNGTLEYDYYFTNDRRLQNNRDAETLIHIRMYHTGNEMRDTNQWNGYADVYFGDHSVDPNNGFLPIDNIIIGIGYPNSSNTPVVTDREEYKIIYNGSTGPQGPQGQEGPQGPKGEDGESVVTYEYLNGTIMRVSAWNDGTTGSTKYWNGETRVLGEGSSEHDGGNEGIKYLDVVSVTSNGKTNWYKCISNHAKRSANPATDTSYWSEFSIMGDAAFRNLLVENAAYIENLTVKNLNTAGEGSSALERIVASGNTMYMTDNTGAQKFKLTGDDVNWTTPLATYPQQNTSYYGSYSNETISDSFERSLFGTIAVSAPNSTLTIPDLQITADVNGCTSGQPQDWTSIGITVDVYLYKNGTQYATVGSATLEYSPEDDIDTTNASISSKSFSVSTGNYTIMLVASINGQRGAQCSYVSIDLTFGSTANNVTVSSTDANENNVQIGSNGMAIQLGNGFAVIFGIDSNSSPLIQLQGTNSQGSTVGIRITSAGLEKNTGSGWGSL